MVGLAALVISATLSEALREILLIVSLVGILFFELTGRAGALPQARRLVPQTILRTSRVAGPLQFGFEMGTGVRTFMPSALPFALVSLLLFQAESLLLCALAGVAFGLGRALVRPARSRDPLQWDRRLRGARRTFSGVLTGGFVVLAALLF